MSGKTTASARWKRGRGKLGSLEPLLGSWRASAESPMGPVTCVRTFERVLRGNFVELRATWHVGDKVYEERAMFGVDASNTLGFWSFTNDGKSSRGTLADVSDLHAEAVGFEAEVPAGLARQAYWPDGEGGVVWVVEARNKKGWKRFVEHRYLPEAPPRE